MRQIIIKELATIRKPKEGEGVVGNTLYVLGLLFSPIILFGGLMIMAIAACLSFFQSVTTTKEEKEKLKNHINDRDAATQWMYWTEINGIKFYQNLIGEIRFGPGYFYVKSEPTISALNDKIFGDWFFQHEDELFLQQWNSTKSPNTNLLRIDTKDLRLDLIKDGLPSVNWRMVKTEDKKIKLDCDTGKEILQFVIE